MKKYKVFATFYDKVTKTYLYSNLYWYNTEFEALKGLVNYSKNLPFIYEFVDYRLDSLP